MKNLFFLSFLILLLASCTNVHFVSPQPEFVDALTEIPEKYHGEFLIESDENDVHIVTGNTIDGINISTDSGLVVKERGNYFYVNIMDDEGYYILRIIRLIKYLNYEDITLYAPHLYERNYTRETQSNLFNIVSRVGKNKDPVLDNVTVNQLSILTKSTNAQEIVRLK